MHCWRMRASERRKHEAPPWGPAAGAAAACKARHGLCCPVRDAGAVVALLPALRGPARALWGAMGQPPGAQFECTICAACGKPPGKARRRRFNADNYVQPLTHPKSDWIHDSCRLAAERRDQAAAAAAQQRSMQLQLQGRPPTRSLVQQVQEAQPRLLRGYNASTQVQRLGGETADTRLRPGPRQGRSAAENDAAAANGQPQAQPTAVAAALQELAAQCSPDVHMADAQQRPSPAHQHPSAAEVPAAIDAVMEDLLPAPGEAHLEPAQQPPAAAAAAAPAASPRPPAADPAPAASPRPPAADPGSHAALSRQPRAALIERCRRLAADKKQLRQQLVRAAARLGKLEALGPLLNGLQAAMAAAAAAGRSTVLAKLMQHTANGMQHSSDVALELFIAELRNAGLPPSARRHGIASKRLQASMGAQQSGRSSLEVARPSLACLACDTTLRSLRRAEGSGAFMGLGVQAVEQFADHDEGGCGPAAGARGTAGGGSGPALPRRPPSVVCHSCCYPEAVLQVDNEDRSSQERGGMGLLAALLGRRRRRRPGGEHPGLSAGPRLAATASLNPL